MADVGFRDLGAFVPGRRSEPVAPPLPTAAAQADAASVIITPPPPASKPQAIFAGDVPSGGDALGIEGPIAHLAELVAHRATPAPLGIGLLGGAGSGKSFALHRLVERVGELTAAAAKRPGPFLASVHVELLDAATLDGDPAPALAAQLHAGLRQPYPELAREIGHTARDPLTVARETSEKLDEARRRLDAERRTLDESGSRLARLTETVLYEAAGSQVDAYARANRASLESRLYAFGMGGDAIRTYKDLVRIVAEGGPFGLALRSLYGFKGQARLIILAIVFALIGFGFNVAIDTQESWLAALHGGPQVFATTGDWLSTHMGLLALARRAAYGLALLCILADVWRAFRFMQPVMTGARLLKADLANRRRDLDSLYAHQTKRVDGLSAEVDRLTRAAAEAERRAGGAQPGLSEPPLFEIGARAQAERFFAALGRLIRGDGGQQGPAVPQRIVLGLDHLDAVEPDRARQILDTLHRLAGGTGLVTVLAIDPWRLKTDVADLERWIQVPLRLDASAQARDYAALVSQALGRSAGAGSPAPVDATRSALDKPVSDEEASLLTALAPLAGASPRAVKRFINLYAIARLDDAARRGPLALMLALDQGGTQAERQAVETAMAGDDHDAAFELRQTSPRLRTALDALNTYEEGVTKAEVARAARRAALFSITAFA